MTGGCRRVLRRSAWRPRSPAFMAVEVALAWISGSYGLNLVYDGQYRRLVSPMTIESIQQFAPLDTWGWSLAGGAFLLLAGTVAHSPVLAIAGHVVQVFILTALGVAVFEVDALNHVFLIIGAVLHPVLAATVTGDAVRTAVRTAPHTRR
jgi:hypothetical protein